VSVVPTGVPDGIVMSASVLALVIYIYSGCVGHTIVQGKPACVGTSLNAWQ